MTRHVMLAYRVLTKLGLTKGHCLSHADMSININFWAKLQTSGIPAPALPIHLVYVNFWRGWFLMLRIPSDGGARTNRTRDTLFCSQFNKWHKVYNIWRKFLPGRCKGFSWWRKFLSWRKFLIGACKELSMWRKFIHNYTRFDSRKIIDSRWCGGGRFDCERNWRGWWVWHGKMLQLWESHQSWMGWQSSWFYWWFWFVLSDALASTGTRS